MLRVLLAVDDYGELLFLQTLLKKLGFDVDGIQNQRSFEDSFLSLNPEVIVATANGKRVNGIEIAENLRRTRGLPRIVLLANAQLIERLKVSKFNNVDGILESPVSAARLLEMLAQLANLDKVALLEKYRKLKETLSVERETDRHILQRDALAVEPPEAKKSGEPEVVLKGTSLSSEERKRRYQDNLAGLPKPEVQRFERDRIVEFTREIRASEHAEDVTALENERQSFVKALFRKAKS